jgi:hypothetical protein
VEGVSGSGLRRSSRNQPAGDRGVCRGVGAHAHHVIPWPTNAPHADDRGVKEALHKRTQWGLLRALREWEAESNEGVCRGVGAHAHPVIPWPTNAPPLLRRAQAVPAAPSPDGSAPTHGLDGQRVLRQQDERAWLGEGRAGARVGDGGRW